MNSNKYSMGNTLGSLGKQLANGVTKMVNKINPNKNKLKNLKSASLGVRG